MESAIFGLLGVTLGFFLNFIKEWWLQSRKVKKDAGYLAIQVSCELELYAIYCSEIVGDDGLRSGQRDEGGCLRIQTNPPKFDPKILDVEWKSLPAGLMYKVLEFPYKAEIAGQFVSIVFENSDPPDYWEGFEERQLQYAKLGIEASQLATELREHVGLPERPISETDPVHYMERRKSEIEQLRVKRSEKESGQFI